MSAPRFTLEFMTSPGILSPDEVRISTRHIVERHAKEEKLTGEDHLAAAPA